MSVGIVLWLATATDVGAGLRFRGVPYGLALLVIGLALRMVGRPTKQKPSAVRETKRTRAIQGPARPATARVVSVEVPMELATLNIPGERVARLALEVSDGTRTFEVSTVERLPPAYLSRIEVGTELPVMVGERNQEQIEIDWQRWNE